jgi:hypothetical protein
VTKERDFSSLVSRPATRLSVGIGVLFAGVKLFGCDADQSPLSSTNVKNWLHSPKRIHSVALN